jgi:LPS sulfotransferase NodH
VVSKWCARGIHKDAGSVPIFATGLDADVYQAVTESIAVRGDGSLSSSGASSHHAERPSLASLVDPKLGETVKSVLICTLPRTGSSMLAQDMRSTKALGSPGEFFLPNRYEKFTESWGVPQGDLDGYIKELHAKTASPNGVVAVKLMVRHLDFLTQQGMLPSEPGRLRNLTQHFGDVVIIKLLRKDKLRQAISLTKAQQTGKWGSLKEQRAEPFYDRDALIANLVRIV